MAAAMKRTVIAVDPMIKNLALINQSLKQSKLLHYVSFINSPIRFLPCAWHCKRNDFFKSSSLFFNMSNPLIIVNNSFHVFSDKIEVLFPVNIQKINPGGTKLVPASLLTPSLNKSISGDPVVSTTLYQLIKFASSNQLILKLDIEVNNLRYDFQIWIQHSSIGVWVQSFETLLWKSNKRCLYSLHIHGMGRSEAKCWQ